MIKYNKGVINMIEEIKKYDPDFTENGFKTFIDNVFIQIHLAIMTKDIKKIKHFVSDEIYKKIEDKVKYLSQNHLIQMYDEINVKETRILSSEITEDKINIKVNIISRYMDYFLDEDGNFKSGNNTSRIMRDNYITFTKKLNAKDLGNVKKCQNCGASLEINASGLCPYCRSTFDLERGGYIITSLEVM